MALGLTPHQIIQKGTHPLLEIAKDWNRIELKYIATIQNGYAFSSKLFNHNEGMPLIRIRDIFSSETQNLYSGEYKEEFVVSRGDILIGMDGDFRVSKWPGEIGLLNQRVCRLHFDSNLYYKEFLFLCIQPYLDAIHSETSAVTVKHLSSRTINDIPFPLPPLPIQRAIVAKIESLFSSLDSGIADLKKAQDQLVIYRQAVLKKAFEGELTKEWRELQNKNYELGITNEKLPSANELLEQIKEIEELPKIPEEWIWIKSNELFSFVTSGSRGWAKYYSNSGAIFIRITNLNFDTLELDLRSEKIQFVNPPIGSEGIRTRVNRGDFLFSITGYLGMFAIAPELENAYVNQHVSLCRPKDGFNKKYVGYWVISKSGGIHYLNKNQKGAVKAGLNLDDLKTFPVPICSIEEQHQVVQEIESRLSVCDKVEESITESLIKAQALRQSILKKAFEGKLLSAEEIAKCKVDKDYEPASVLLKRIKAEKKQK